MMEVAGCKLAEDLLWADPIDSYDISAFEASLEYSPNKTRGLSVSFNEVALNRCLADCKIDMVIRAHQVQDEGFLFHYGGRKLLTVFSAPKYANEKNNKGAFLLITQTGEMMFKQLVSLNWHQDETVPQEKKMVDQSKSEGSKTLQDNFTEQEAKQGKKKQMSWVVKKK